MDERAIVAAFQQLIQERDSLGSAVIERQTDVAEHDLVIKTLEPLDGGRKCHRLVGEVLVEQTVAEVLPAVRSNRDNLKGVAESLEKALQAKQKEALAFQQKYNIRIRGEGDEEQPGGGGGAQQKAKPGSGGGGAGGTGVLVGS
eukprot:scaffold22.g6067.t1